jgi:RNA polymerase sigma factor (sigma-70 family)
MMTTPTMSAAEYNDAELVMESLAGNRDAFEQIVAHHQSLICALAYSATGSLTASEDLAQETFVTAWKHLRELREPAKLRAWLCGIVRNLIGKKLRRDGREPAHAAEPLDEADESPAPEPQPPDHVMGQEEEAILWRSLERIPEAYREPLVLFYREHQSIERVAEALDLKEDAVRQRLSRGRKLLQEQVLAFVEGALERTSPGKTFTLGVLAALPFMTTSARAAVVGVAVGKSSVMAKSAGLAGLFNGILGPFLGLYFDYRLNQESAGSSQRREFIAKYYRIAFVGFAAFGVAALSLVLSGQSLLPARPTLLAGLLIGLGVAYFIFFVALTVWMRRCLGKTHRLEMSDGRLSPVLRPLYEYRSKLGLLGLPLVHIRIRGGLERGPVKAWIAAGDAAVGALFAFGAVAIAPISFGGIAVGLVTLGGIAMGLLSFGGFSLGPWAIGGMATGGQAFGGCAIAWWAAQGGVAVAHGFAIGGVALAQHANDAAAEAFIRDAAFFQHALAVMRYAQWLNLLWLLPLALWWWQRKNNRKPLRPGH